MRRLAPVVGVLAALLSLVAGTSIAARQYQPVRLSLPTQLPDAAQGRAYAVSLARDVGGGTGPPYQWTLRGSLPKGLHLNASTGAIGGTVARTAPVRAYAFSVCATGAKRPVGGSAPGNTACDSTRIAVVKASGGNGAAPAACSFTLAAEPPGVNVTIDGPSQTSVIAVNWNGNGCTGKVTFSTVGSPPTGLSLSFLAPPAGIQGTTLSLAAAQDASEGAYQLTVLGTSGSARAQTVVTVTIAEPDFSGTYTGRWSGTFVSSGPDGCNIGEGGAFTAVVVKQLPSGYSVTMTFAGRTERWNGSTCQVTGTVDDQFVENGSYSSGSVRGATFTITGNSISGQRTDSYPGGTEASSFSGQR